MSIDLERLLRSLPGLRVLVLGDAILDSYLLGTAGRISREAPVPVVAVDEQRDVAGGAANTAVNAAGLGGEVTLLCPVGDDEAGRKLRACLEEGGVSTSGVLVDPSRETLSKSRVVAGGHIMIRFDRGATQPMSPHIETAFVAGLARLFPFSDAVIVSDYSYGAITPRVLDALADLQARTPRVIVVDAREPELYRTVGVTAVKPNYREAARLLGIAESPRGDGRIGLIASAGDRLLDLTGARLAAVTIDAEGALLLERGRPPYRTYARPAGSSKATGAGDTFAAALALALVAGAHGSTAAELASAAAAVVVGKDGTATCTLEEIGAHVFGEEKYLTDLERLRHRVESYRRQGKRVVFTNGCFDILHRGHITYLNQAKTMGDVLVVGLNSDESVRRLKGGDRPINRLEDRAHVLAALSCIDHIVAFEEDTPAALIEALRPEVFVKGGDYTRESLPETPIVESRGGTVRILPLVEDRSTSGIIEHIRGVPSAPAPAPR